MLWCRTNYFRRGIEPDSGIRGKRMSNYYVSGCIDDGESVSMCDDGAAQFWTLYHRNDDGLSEGIIDCMFREDAEAAMRVYEHRDALAAENARMKKAIKRIFPEGVADEKRGIGFSDAAKECYASAIETLATDAYLNTVRADAVQYLWDNSLSDVGQVLAEIRAYDDASEAAGIVHDEIKERIGDYAAQLRAGEPS